MQSAAEIIGQIPHDYRCLDMVAFLFRESPNDVSQTKLMQLGRFSESIQGPLCAYTAFEYWMLQLNAELRRFGWRIEEHGIGYRVVPNAGVQ